MNLSPSTRRLRARLIGYADAAQTQADRQSHRLTLTLLDGGRITPGQASRLAAALNQGDAAADLAAWVLRLIDRKVG